MDRRTIIIVALCVLVFIFYRPLLNRLGLGKFLEPPRPAPTAPAPDTSRAARAPATAPATAPPARPAAPPSPPSLGVEPPPQAIERSLDVETPLYDAQFSNLGARLVSVQLKRFASAHGVSSLSGTVHRPRPGEDVPPGDRVVLAGAPTFELALGSGASLRPLTDLAYDVAESTDASGRIRALTFTARDPSGIHLRQTYRIDPDSYAIGLEVEMRDVPPTLPVTDYSLTVRSWPALTEADRLSDQRALRASSLVGTNLHRDGAIGLFKRPRSYDGNVAWAGVQSRYFLAAAALVQGAARGVAAHGEERPLPPGAIPRLQRGERAVQEIAVNTMIVSLPSAAQPVHRFVLYAGPSEYGQLDQLQGTQLERAVDLGWTWIRPISALLLRLLHWIDLVARNYGVAIILLATVLRLVLHPLNMSSMKSMRAMQRLQPEMDRLREKYKNDPQAMNTQIMALYKENKVNPAGGCLPMLIQMPVLVALYQVLFNAIELRQAPFVGWINDLSAPEQLFSVGGFPLRLLPLLMTGSGLVLQRMTPTSPQQAPTAYMMNLFMLVIFYNMPSGLVLYWTVMNLLSALQQWLVLRQDGAPVVVREAPAEAGRKRSSGRG
ncbi:MAG TPA: YidC/Oxa1 family insertase periplasmic-domain containing protein [Candidatus Eisenbacteria bacterium]